MHHEKTLLVNRESVADEARVDTHSGAFVDSRRVREGL